MRDCWCGSNDLAPFDGAYAECRVCGTLVFQGALSTQPFAVKDDERDYYGKQYWLKHQQDDFGHDDIYQRARTDLSERNLHWLRALLRYRLPPARIMELGCAHGSFVALLRQAGYEAFGVEMSPWVVAFGQRTFGIPVQTGPLEALDPHGPLLDVIVLMDVLEHLADPFDTMRRCLTLLAQDGLLLIQTPCFPRGRNQAQLLAARDRFLEMLIPQEHVYLFSRDSVAEMFRRLGAEHVEFEPAMFSHYDMFFAVSRKPLLVHDTERIAEVLLAEPGRRFALALLDLRRQLEGSESDRIARGVQIETLTTLLRTAETNRTAQVEAVTDALQIAQRRLAAQPKWLRAVSDLFGDDQTRAALAQSVRRRIRVGAAVRQPAPDRAAGGPRVVAVDLTPVLPGGTNGGAKIFVLDLLRRLTAQAPQTQFILLTQTRTHDELAALDAANVRRILVLDTTNVPAAVDAPAPAARARQFLIRKSRGAARRLGLERLASWSPRRPPGLLRGLGVDLLFCPFTAPTYAEAGISTVCTVYDLQYKSYPEFFLAADLEQREQTFLQACKRSTALAAISEYARRSAIAHGRLDAHRVRTISLRMARRILAADHPGASTSEAGTAKSVLVRLALEPRRYLLYPANFWRHKNHEMLLTAFGIARRSGLPADVQLVCTGAPGERQQDLLGAAAAMGLIGLVQFPGFVPDHELAALMHYSAGVVFPSLYEGFGLPVLEAMAAGVPVACSDTTSLPEVASGAAKLFDPRIPTQIADAMTSLLTDLPLCAQLIEAGRLRAAEYADAERMAREYWELFVQASAAATQASASQRDPAP